MEDLDMKYAQNPRPPLPPQPTKTPPQQSAPDQPDQPDGGMIGGAQDFWHGIGEGVRNSGITADDYYDLLLSPQDWIAKRGGNTDDHKRWRKRMQTKLNPTGGVMNWFMRNLMPRNIIPPGMGRRRI